ncbi:hypothetical protein ABEW19_10090 [Paenibacillus illinoisensis]|uniref:hypothetical protein n=1 Tax=Paenibacillus illinoisensis TaxID=59845 RepID=UPI003D28A319
MELNDLKYTPCFISLVCSFSLFLFQSTHHAAQYSDTKPFIWLIVWATDNLIVPVIVHVAMNVGVALLFKYRVILLKKDK